MLVKRLEFQFDERFLARAALEDIPKMFCGEFTRSLSNLGVELFFGSEEGLALIADDERTVCRVIGDDDAVVMTMRAPKNELQVHEGPPR